MTTAPAAMRARARSAWLFLAPALATLTVVAAWPLARTVFFSLTDATLVHTSQYRFVGLENYVSYEDGQWYGLITDSQFLQSLRNTVLFAVCSVAIEAVLGVGIALLLNVSFRGRWLLRAALLVPWAIPTVVSARMWSWMLNDQFGIVNDALVRTGIIGSPVAWLADPALTMASVIMVDVWKTTPFVSLLVLAALQMAPKDCYEAARVDGIPPLQVFYRITLPFIRPALAVAVIFRLLDAMRMFDLVYVMTGATDATMTLSVFARRELVDFQQVGYGSAASTLLFLAIALMTLLYIRFVRADLEPQHR
ncbi:MAG: carbohydrate ABC transporter permease [Vicinamibacterales bacterium]